MKSSACSPGRPRIVGSLKSAAIDPGKHEPRRDLRSTFDALATIGATSSAARLVADNVEAWNARWALLEQAQESIDASYFTVDRDVFGMAFVGHLLKKAREGKAVRLLIDSAADALGRSFKIAGRDCLNELVRSGAEVRYFNPIHRRPREVGFGCVAQNHDKILVVDGKAGITGGRNIAQAYYADPNDMPDAWRDTDVLLRGRGPAAALAKAIDAETDDDRKAPKVGKGMRSQKRDIELLGAYAMMEAWLSRAPLSAEEKTALRKDPERRAAMAKSLVEDAVRTLPSLGVDRSPNYYEYATLDALARQLAGNTELAGSKARFDERVRSREVEVEILDKTSAADPEQDEFKSALAAACDSAKESVLIQNPYLVLTEPMIQTLERASARGVKITILTNSPASTDSALTQAFFLADWKYLLARVPTARIFVFTGERKMHAKTAIADGELSLVSTYNLDLLSSDINGEVGALVRSKAFARDLEESIAADRADPRNGVIEYRIKKDEHGKAVLVNGEPVVEVGPEHHLSPRTLLLYRLAQKAANVARRTIPQLAALRHPPLAGG